MTCRSATIAGVRLFYREAGSRSHPSILLLHGFPSSSTMFAGLMPLLADRYHLIAPDYPGFGQSDAPPPSEYDYTFDSLARSVDGLLDHLGIVRYALFLQDYGGPVGMRLALRHPDRIRAMIVQNANAYEEGLGPKWQAIRAFWNDRDAHQDAVVGSFVSLESARLRHIANSPCPERYDPAIWFAEHALLSRSEQFGIQADLLFDYRTNVAAYPVWQAWMREHRPATLVTWGRYDTAFLAAGALAYRTDLPDAEIHVLDAGHFALDEKLDEIAGLVRDFLGRQIP